MERYERKDISHDPYCGKYRRDGGLLVKRRYSKNYILACSGSTYDRCYFLKGDKSSEKYESGKVGRWEGGKVGRYEGTFALLTCYCFKNL